MDAPRGPSEAEGATGGTYVLFLRPLGGGRLRVGSLGTMELAAGRYAYVGSAFGPGGLEARLGRHLRGDGRLHWHVDYLRRRCEPTAAWVTRDRARREHEWARALAATAGSTVPLSGFGASDCGCVSHLFHLAEVPERGAFGDRAAAEAGSGDEPTPVRRWEP